MTKRKSLLLGILFTAWSIAWFAIQKYLVALIVLAAAAVCLWISCSKYGVTIIL